MSDYVYGLNKSGISVIKLLNKQKKTFVCWDDNKNLRDLVNKNLPKLKFKKINKKKLNNYNSFTLLLAYLLIIKNLNISQTLKLKEI